MRVRLVSFRVWRLGAPRLELCRLAILAPFPLNPHTPCPRGLSIPTEFGLHSTPAARSCIEPSNNLLQVLSGLKPLALLFGQLDFALEKTPFIACWLSILKRWLIPIGLSKNRVRSEVLRASQSQHLKRYEVKPFLRCVPIWQLLRKEPPIIPQTLGLKHKGFRGTSTHRLLPLYED